MGDQNDTTKVLSILHQNELRINEKNSIEFWKKIYKRISKYKRSEFVDRTNLSPSQVAKIYRIGKSVYCDNFSPKGYSKNLSHQTIMAIAVGAELSPFELRYLFFRGDIGISFKMFKNYVGAYSALIEYEKVTKLVYENPSDRIDFMNEVLQAAGLSPTNYRKSKK